MGREGCGFGPSGLTLNGNLPGNATSGAGPAEHHREDHAANVQRIKLRTF